MLIRVKQSLVVRAETTIWRGGPGLVGSLAPAGRLPGEGSAHTLGGPQLLHQDQVPGAVRCAVRYFISDISVKRLSHEIFDHSFLSWQWYDVQELDCFFQGQTKVPVFMARNNITYVTSKGRPSEKPESGQNATNCLRFGLAFQARGTKNYGQH
jgi:hypothetical protein